MMGEISLEKALGKLSSDKQKDRTDGLTDIKHILQQNKGSSKLSDLNDKACHKIFESLFRFVALEKSAFDRSQRSNSRSPAVARLSTCASAIRTAVDVFLRNLRTKTVRAIIDHITDTIPVPGEGLWEILGVDYIKCLASLLHYAPHNEHLGDAEWQKLIDFCLAAINIQKGEESQLSIRNGNWPSPGNLRDSNDSRSTPARQTPAPATRENLAGKVNCLGEIIECVQLLTESSSAPLQPAAEDILRCLVNFVKSSSTIAGSTQQLAFSTINAVVLKVLFDQTDLVRSSALDVIPVIRRLWSSKLLKLKDELLITIMICMVILSNVDQQELSETVSRSIESLTDTLHSEYLKRPEKDLLQLDDVTLGRTSDSNNERPIYGPRIGNNRSENNWTLIWTIANLSKLSEKIQICATEKDDAELDNSSKRRRFNSGIDDIFRDAVSATGTRRVCALQLIPLILNERNIEEKSDLIQRLIPGILDDNSTISSWTMLTLASLLSDPVAKLPILGAFWERVMNLTSRAISSLPTSRAACHLLSLILEADLLEHSVVTEYIRSMLASANLNGPSTISDSSLSLWASIVRQNKQLNFASAQSASKQVCSWMKEVWTIGSVTNRVQTAQVSMFARPLNLLNLFMACTGRPFELPVDPSPDLGGPIAKTWLFLYENKALLEYIFDADTDFQNANPWCRQEPWNLSPSTRQDVDDSVILDLLKTKAEFFVQAWQAIARDKSVHVTADVLQILSSFCITSALFLTCLPGQVVASQGQSIFQACQFLWEDMCSFLAVNERTSCLPCLEILSTILPSSVSNFDGVYRKALSPLISPLSDLLEGFRESQRLGHSSSGDLMDLDERIETEVHGTSAYQHILSQNRQHATLLTDASTFQRLLTVKISILRRCHDESRTPGLSTLVEYLVDLDEADLLSSFQFLSDVFRDLSKINKEGLLQILEHIGEKCLQSYEMERCETSHSICVRMMSGFVSCWADNQTNELSESAMDLYNWFLEVLLTKKRASPTVYTLLLELLHSVLNTCPSYGFDQQLPSPRTSLLQILQEGDIPVKFTAANLIPTLFERYHFRDHDLIFDDVLENLPRDPEWIEGIALRLFVLSRLASKWPTLLRRSIYHMFETPAQIPLSLAFARKCVKSVSNALGLHDPRELFRLFASQILYTWTETQNVTSMPFSMFAYTSLREMLEDIKDEIVGQMMMRAKEAETHELASYMNTPHQELIENSFSKAEAYSIARDISTPPSQGSQPKGVEVLLRKLLGADGFMKAVEANFPSIIVTFFKSLDRYDQIERAFSKRPTFNYALEIQTQILSKCETESTLPPNQQPSFRARYLLDELEFLCKRAGFELESIWTPTLVTFVCRSLLDSIHPALGSLHMCSVIRKIRILVSLAGPIALEDYPFEMLLQSLRPLLAEVECSEDTLGIFWYLLEAGKPYLAANPGFTAGILVATFVTLRKIFSWGCGENNEGSRPQAALHSSRNFHQWLCEFVREYSSLERESHAEKTFSSLLTLAQDISRPNGSSNMESEKQLVIEVLTDRHSAQSLMGKTLTDVVLSLLCPEFKWSLHTGDGIANNDSNATSHVIPLWHTLQKFDGGPEYRLWAASVIGRSFAESGKVDEHLLREQDLSLFKTPEPANDLDIFCHSKARIIQTLCEKLQTQNNMEAGLIEHTLQLILSKITQYPDFSSCVEGIPESLVKSLIWNPYTCPTIPFLPSEVERCNKTDISVGELSLTDWARTVSLFLSSAALEDPVIGSLRKILNVIPDLAVQTLPYIIHDVLLAEEDDKGPIREALSDSFQKVLCNVCDETILHARLVISCVLYLRNQRVPEESTITQRDRWLEIDYGEASSAAHRCGLQKTSLLFLEIQASRVTTGSRRTSVVKYEPPFELLHNVFKNIDDPDLFYGIQQSSSLDTVMERLEYESLGFKNLLFQSAQYDSEIQILGSGKPYGVLKALNSTNLQGIANTMTNSSGNTRDTSNTFNSTLQAAMNLQQWDIPVSPLESSPQSITFRAFQNLNSSSSLSEITSCVDRSLLMLLDAATEPGQSAMQLRTAMRNLGVLTEMSDLLRSPSTDVMHNEWDKIIDRRSWLKTESYHEVGEILSWHEGLCSSVRKHVSLQSKLGLTQAESRLIEAKVFRQSLEVTRSHGISQASLKAAICLSKLSDPCAELGINIDGAAQFDLANVLWDQGEMTASIRMLQQLKGCHDLNKQTIPLSRAELLVTLGHHVAEARLEKPEAILQAYLYPAVKELKGASEGEAAGRVYHGFAAFCDQQLLNQDGLEDYKRVQQLRDRKERELRSLEEMLKTAQGREKESLKHFRAKTKQWFDLDDREYQRLSRSREAFLQQCLENYLLALRESDAYNNDALRFCALWFDKSETKIANTAVSRYLNDVPSRKFAPLMNQLSSRLLDVSDDFQKLLTGLVFKICSQHPFHGMYQLFASSKSKGGKDQSSHSRHRAASKLVELLKNDKEIGPTWISVHNMNITYVRFAVDQMDSKYKSGAKIPLSKLPTGERLVQDVNTYKLPPPTMKIELREDGDYSQVPFTAKFQSEFTLASGVSAPKIVTAIASDGVRYKQLYKGGNDDLRQDTIMEQVFEQVSSLLKDHQPTRQRNLGIRTYKVLPLTLNAGIIEFVPNTIPLNDYLMPAHQRYFPKDMKPNACRKHIADVQTRSFEQRVRTYRQVTESFHPVMKFFFMERFNNPDDWFSKRIAYTRSTAAISILGHVLGLGDRHGHNILLDEKTGEVIHIDLGVAFEQGRILPVPEVVPFRLTRDLVDGFGITKTEGTFRRCCEFTLEALRQESYSIMTILDVLRYDPLYSWTVSPLRMKKMQDNQEGGDGPPVLAGTTDKGSTSSNEPSEADRALTVVAKKLSKTLSVTATVNELIQQATDEKNLAVLYCGWAPYA